MNGAHLRIAAALFVAALGCSGEKQPVNQRASLGTGPAEEKPSKGPRTGGYIVLPSSEPKVLNPVLQQAFDLAHPMIFEGLVSVDAKGELVPRLAESWERSPDEKTLTFRLRKNVVWHDLKPFSSADVLFTVDKIRSSQSSWAGYLQPVQKIEAPDPHTVVVTLAQPYGPDLASFTFGIVPRHVFEGQDFEKADANRAPIGTGPFKFIRWTPGQSMILEAHANHWAGRPHVDQVTLVFESQIAPPDYLAALQARKLDFAPIREVSDWAGLLGTPEFREQYEIGAVDEPVITLIAWNGQKKPFDDKRVRVALAHALDRQRVIEDVLQGSAHALSAPLYPTMWGADPSVPSWPFDLAKAAQLLDEAGLAPKGDGKRLSFELVISQSFRGPVLDQTVAIFRTDLAAIGVDLKVTYIPRNELVGRLILRNFDAALYQWGADIPDPDPFVLLHTSQVGAGNYAGYSNAEVDKLVETARATTVRSTRKAAYAQIHRIVHEEEPYTVLYTRQDQFAWSRRLRGVNPIDVSAIPRWPGVARWWVVE